MTKDPEYKHLVDKHGNLKNNGDGSLTTVEQHRCQAKWARHAINLIERRMKINGDGLGAMLNNIMAKSMMGEMLLRYTVRHV